MTGDEVAAWTGLELYQARRRISDLHNEGKIEDSGQRRKTKTGRNAVVWQIRPRL
jgi:predicted ArsR family transcriptional regulator